MAYAESFRGGPKLRHNRVTSQTSFAFVKAAWFCFTFFHFWGMRGGGGAWHNTPLGTLVGVGVAG